MHLIVWRYEVAPEHEAAFRAAYGPQGDWARLFGRGVGFVGVELFAGARGVYLTVDSWMREADFAAFKSGHGPAYTALDARLAHLTRSEVRLGAMETG